MADMLSTPTIIETTPHPAAEAILAFHEAQTTTEAPKFEALPAVVEVPIAPSVTSFTPAPAFVSTPSTPGSVSEAEDLPGADTLTQTAHKIELTYVTSHH